MSTQEKRHPEIPDYDHADGNDSDLDILHEARENISNWYNYMAPNYETGRNDEYFLMHDQWSPDDRSDLLLLGMPILTANKVQDIVKKVIGETWEIDPQIMVRSLDYVEKKNDQGLLSEQNTIDLLQNLMRNIAYRSDSRQAYFHGFEQAIQRGYGAFRVDTRYKNTNSFDIEPYICKVDMTEMAFFDPMATDVHKGDGRFCGFYNVMTKKEFMKMYPDVPVPRSFPSYTYPTYFYWGDKKCVSVVDMYCKEQYTKTIYKLSDNRVMDKDKYEKLVESYKSLTTEVPKIIDDREAEDFRILHYRFTYDQVLEKNVFPGKILPMFFVDRRSYKIDGRQYTKSFIHDAIDSQRALNYLNVGIIQHFKNNRKENYIASTAQIAGLEEIWMRPENQNGVLPYNPDPLAPAPQKQPPSEVPQSLLAHYQRLDMELKSILGYDLILGAQNDVMSGKAMNAKIRQGNLSTYMERANLVAAIEQCGKCILSMIPELYDTEQVVTVMTPDKKHKNVVVNKKLPSGGIENDLTQGNFEVAITVGASYEMQKEAALESLLKLADINPQIFSLIADLIAGNVDVENKEQLVERLSTLVPEEIKAKERGEKMPKPQPQQPNPQLLVEMGNLQLKNNELQFKNKQLDQEGQLKMRQQQIDVAKLQLEAQGQLTDAQSQNLKSIAEITRANAEVKSSAHEAMSTAHNALGKLADFHKTRVSKQESKAM